VRIRVPEPDVARLQPMFREMDQPLTRLYPSCFDQHRIYDTPELYSHPSTYYRPQDDQGRPGQDRPLSIDIYEGSGGTGGQAGCTAESWVRPERVSRGVRKQGVRRG
jgi:hypothetical protein